MGQVHGLLLQGSESSLPLPDCTYGSSVLIAVYVLISPVQLDSSREALRLVPSYITNAKPTVTPQKQMHNEPTIPTGTE